MSSPKAPRTPLKPTDKANGTPKSPDSIKKMASTQPDAGNVVKKRVPSQRVKADTTTPNKAVSPQTPRPKPPKSLEDQPLQTPSPDRSSKRKPTTDTPPKFKAATSTPGDAAKTVIKKVKNSSPPLDAETETRDHVDGPQNEVKRVTKQAPPPQEEVKQLRNNAEKPGPKFKSPDVESGEKPKPVVKKKKPAPPPPEPEQELEHDEAVSDHDEVEREDNEDEGNENEYGEESGHEEEPEQGDSEEGGYNGEGAGSDWDGEHETHDGNGDDDYEGHVKGGHDDGTDGEQDTQSQHSDNVPGSLGGANEEASNPAPVTTDKESEPTKDIKHKARKSTPAAGSTTAAKDPDLLEDLVAEPDAVFGDDADALGVTQVDVHNGDGDANGANSSRVAGNSTLLQSGGGGGIGITANGIEINVQTTKEGTSVTIKIPGVSQQ
ncbi:hypothetical protein VE02_04130 [Pseudogymnoascus sp. 03VT05]|nr:hypothetical protein VE02_04130 [Pseudogymnoascus sp. 03VT05]